MRVTDQVFLLNDNDDQLNMFHVYLILISSYSEQNLNQGFHLAGYFLTTDD